MNMNCSIHTLNLPCNFVLLMISRPLSACSFTPFPCSVSFRLQLYHLPRLLTGAFDTVGIVWPPMWNSTFSSTLPLFRDRLRDLSGLNFILDHVISESSLFSICCALVLQFAITVVSSMKAFSGGICTPFPRFAASASDSVAFKSTCIASTNNTGETVHPIAIPTSSLVQLVVYEFVSNLILKSLKYCFRIPTIQSGTWCISKAFHRRPCGTDPYALARSSHMSILLVLALWIASHIIDKCSR